MLVRLVDKQGFKSPILYIHNDEDEFLEQIKLWRRNLLIWAEKTNFKGLPLSRLEADICIVDLLRHLTSYYVLTSPLCEGRITMTLRLLHGKYYEEDITEIKTYEED